MMGARWPISARIGFHASVAAMSTDASERRRRSMRRTHRTSWSTITRRARPTCRRQGLAAPAAARAVASASAIGSSMTIPAKKIIHERSVSDSNRPKRRSAWTAGHERDQYRRRPAEERRRAGAPGMSQRLQRGLNAGVDARAGTQLCNRERDERAGEEYCEQQERDPLRSRA